LNRTLTLRSQHSPLSQYVASAVKMPLTMLVERNEHQSR
jgi:hypothetical protein